MRLEQWKGFERPPLGSLLEQVVDLSGEMGFAYERSCGFYKDFHVHDRTMFVFPRGACAMEVRTRGPSGRFRIDRGSVLIVPQGLLHDDEGVSAIYDTVALYPSDAMIRAAGLKVPAGGPARKIARTEWLEQLVQRYFYRRVVGPEPNGEPMRFLEHEIAAEIFRTSGVRSKSESRRAPEADDSAGLAAIRYLEANLFETLGLEEIAREVGVSVSTLLRSFREATGRTPYAYLKERRLEEARGQLERSGRSVTEIALLVGYTNLGAFSDAFRSRYGVSPSEVRRKHVKATVLA